MDAIIGTGKCSKREYDIIAERDVAVPMNDGISIDIDIFRPDSDGKFPALLGIAPFAKEIQSERVWPAPTRTRRICGVPDASLEVVNNDFFVRRGYVNVIGSVRGTGKSGGTFQFMSPREVQDTYDLIEWIAQQPWCNGNVGMVGLGYYSAHQPVVAEMQPPHLKAMAPIGTFWDCYRHFWWPGGVLQKGFLRWLVSLVNFDINNETSALKEEIGEEKYRQLIEAALANKDMNRAPEIVDALKNPDQLGNINYLDLLLQPTINEFWNKRGAKPDLSKITVPCYFGSAKHRPSVPYYWQDFKMPKKMIYFPPSYMDRPFYQCTWEMLRWFDYWLKDIDTGIMDEPPVRIFVQGKEDWVETTDYPVPGTRWIPFCLHENNSLSELEPWPEAQTLSYDDKPETRGSIKYYSSPLVESTEVIGPVIVNVFASCRGTDMILTGNFYDVDPEGKEKLLNSGWLRASHREIDETRSKPWLPVHTHTNPQPLVPGQVYEFKFDIWPVANLFKPGHRIMFKISSADNEPENLYEVGHEHLVSGTSNTVSIYHSARYPSHILLPITKGNIVGTYSSGGDISLEKNEFMKLK